MFEGYSLGYRIFLNFEGKIPHSFYVVFWSDIEDHADKLLQKQVWKGKINESRSLTDPPPDHGFLIAQLMGIHEKRNRFLLAKIEST